MCYNRSKNYDTKAIIKLCSIIHSNSYKSCFKFIFIPAGDTNLNQGPVTPIDNNTSY